MKNFRFLIVVIFLLISATSYIFAGVYSYSLKTEQLALESSIEELQAELDDLEVKKNMLNSMESVMKQHPELNFYNNIYYLEPYE